jgi:hypothetical protein
LASSFWLITKTLILDDEENWSVYEIIGGILAISGASVNPKVIGGAVGGVLHRAVQFGKIAKRLAWVIGAAIRRFSSVARLWLALPGWAYNTLETFLGFLILHPAFLF